MPARSPFRIAAPGALLAVVVVVFLVLQSGSGDGTGPTAPAAQTETTSVKPRKRTYTVRENDNLSSIAQRYGLTVEQLRELNPKVDPEAIHKDQRLRLRK